MILQSPTFPRRQPPMMRASSSRIWKRSAILRSFHAIPPEADLMGGIGVVAPLLLHSAYDIIRSEEHTSELQSLMRISYAVFCLKKKNTHLSNTSHSFTTT